MPSLRASRTGRSEVAAPLPQAHEERLGDGDFQSGISWARMGRMVSGMTASRRRAPVAGIVGVLLLAAAAVALRPEPALAEPAAARSAVARSAVAGAAAGRSAVPGSALAGSAVAGSALAGSTATLPAGGSPDLPVLGSTVVTAGQKASGARATALVHGVRRIPGGTVLYFSVGLPAGSPDTPWIAMTNTRLARNVPRALQGSQRLVDMAGNRAYAVLIGADGAALASPDAAWPGTAGRFHLLYQVLPPLPASLTSVDVLIGNSDVIPGVPVTDGVMEPAVDQTGPLTLGAGWPRIDQAAVAGAVRPQDSIVPLTSETSDLKETVVKRSTAGSVSVDLSADVLFAVDSATLNPSARSRIQAAADQINTGAAAGEVRVVGHTDTSGTSAYNQDLSRRRARAVAEVLRPLVSVAGVSFAIDGRGERDPVAENTTDAGRRANRRVSVVFTPKEGK